MQLDNELILKQVEELSVILKPWNEQLVVGGGVALILYDLILSKANAGAVTTTDIDFLIPRKGLKIGKEKISSVLIASGYSPHFKSQDTPAVQSFIKYIEEVEIEVEFLTDNKARVKTDVVELRDVGVNAQPLSYLEMSLQEATPIVLPNGESMQIVTPQAWVFHKGLTFTQRTSKRKMYKDLYGIWFVLTQMQDTSMVAFKALSDLFSKMSPKWQARFKSQLNDWVAAATPEDWAQLTAQDIEGRLTQANFEFLVEKLLNS